MCCSDSNNSKRDRPLVSLVIPTHNRARTLPAVLERLSRQTLDARTFECLVVDSRSTDATPDLLPQLRQAMPNLVPLRCERPGAAAARNMGLDHARGDLVILLDDDILVPVDFLEKMLTQHQKKPNAALVARICDRWKESTDPFLRYMASANEVVRYDMPNDAPVDGRYFFTGCAAIPSPVLNDLRFDEGFETYGFEDVDFGICLCQQGVELWLTNIDVIHDYNPTYRLYCQKRRVAGRALAALLQKHPQRAAEYTFIPRLERWWWIAAVVRHALTPWAMLEQWIRQRVPRRANGSILLAAWFYLDLRLTLYAGWHEGRKKRAMQSSVTPVSQAKRSAADHQAA